MADQGDFDAPSAAPAFDFDRLATALAGLLQGQCAESAFVLGLHGPWGSGKTTLMRAISRKLPESAIILEFNPWKYDQKEALWRALILCVLEKLRAEYGDAAQQGGKAAKDGIQKIDDMERSLYERFTVTEQGPVSINWVAATATAVQLAIGAAAIGLGAAPVAGAAGWLRRLFGQKKTADGSADDTSKQIEQAGMILQRTTVDRAVQQVVSLEQFLKNFRDLLLQLAGTRRVYVLIDDLDRCLPDAALGIFEAIKLFLDAPQCAYIVAVDRAVIRRGLQLRYPAASESGARPLPPIVDPDEYIEKTITLSADLPMLADRDGYDILSSIGPPGRFPIAEAEKILFVLGANPRRLKRFGMTLSLWLDIAEALTQEDKRSLAFSPLEEANRPLFLKLALLGYLNSALLAEMRRDPGLPVRLQQICNAAFGNADPAGPTLAGRLGELIRGALDQIQTEVKPELPLVAQAALDPALWRALRLAPNIAATPNQLEAALRWFRTSKR